MRHPLKNDLLGRSTRGLIGVLALGMAWPGLSDEALAVEALELRTEAEEEAQIDLANYQPGFSLNVAEPEFREEIADLNKFIDAADWAKAFRLLTELKDEQLQVMSPIGTDGQHVLVKEQLQRQLLSLPPDGRRAFRLYFDGQASEQFDKIKNHPLPGSEDQLTQTQALVDRLLASSVGGEAAVLLGDMYFERGMFDQADRNWRLALDHGSATGEQALTLQAKRALALNRAGRTDDARSLFDSLQARYGKPTIQAGGESIDALALLSQSMDQPPADQVNQENAAPPKNLLPARDAMPVWHSAFLSPSKRNTFNQLRNQRSYYSPPTDLVKFVPPVVADDNRVYFHWLGVVFAMDRQTGKQLWRVGSIEETAAAAASRVQSNQGDPRNYGIALSGDRLLVTTTQNQNQGTPFVLKAYDLENGQMQWSSDTQQDWSLGDAENPQKGTTALLGEVAVHEGWAYAVVHRSGQNELFLRRFNPTDGKVDWTIPLGNAEVMAFQYTNVSRMPQPTLVMGPTLLYVMTNNGALIAVDVIAGEAQWALRMTPPFGIGQQPTRGFNQANQLGARVNAMANANGSDRLLIQDGVLYAKEHNGKTLYALDPATGNIKWLADKLKPDAKLIAVTDKHFYLMDRALQCYQTDGDHDLVTKNGNNTGQPDHAGAIPLDDAILIYGDGMLRVLDKQHLDPAGKYENTDFLGRKGGYLYRFDGLLIAIDSTQITAFRNNNN